MNLLLALRDLSLVLALVGLCIAVGSLAIAYMPKVSLAPRELLLSSLGLGIGIVGTGILFVGLVGFADHLGLSALLVGMGILSRQQIKQLPSLASRAIQEGVGGWNHLELGLIGAITLFILAHAALPVANYDSLLYHLSIPELYLREERIFLPPNNFHAAYIGLIHMLYVPLLAFGGSSSPAILSGVMAVALIPLVHLVGEQLWEDETGRLATILVWAGPVLVLVGVTPRVDVTLIWYLLLAHYLVILGLQDRTRSGLPWLAALLLGIAFAVKASAVLYFVGLSPFLVWLTVSRTGTWRFRFRELAILGILVAGPAVPWLVKNWAWFGDPLYPFLTGKATQNWLLGIYNGQMPTFDVALPAIQQIRQPFNVPDFFFAPQRLTPEGEGILYFANPVLLLLPLILLDRRWKQVLLIALPAVIYAIALLFIHERGTNLRYLIPIVVPLTLVSIAGITSTLRNHVRWLATALLLLPLIISLTLWSASQLSWSYLSGEMSEEEYLSVISNQEIRTYINQQTARDSRILFLFDGRVYGIKRARIPDPPGLSNWLRMAPAAATGCLEESGVTHLVLNRHLLEYQKSRGLDPKSIRWDEFPSFEERCLNLLKDGGWYQVYRLGTGGKSHQRTDQ